MRSSLVQWLWDPVSGAPLRLVDPRIEGANVESGELVSDTGVRYPIRQGVPRFVGTGDGRSAAVTSFGDEWNHFNFVQYRTQWLQHTVKNTFGSPDVFRGKVIVDAGAGSGAQALWMLESGAQHVFLLELSHSVDDVIRRNLETSGFTNWDVIQCSIDAPPIRPRSVDLVMCHNVIQHTPSVERTARALFELVRPGGELVFNCYPKNDEGLVRWLRFHLVYTPLRGLLSRMPFHVILGYATVLAALRQVPVAGPFFEKAGFCSQGEVLTPDGSAPDIGACFRATRLNTFDQFGSHKYQHVKTESEIRSLVASLQPDDSKVLNVNSYFERPAPIGCALRVRR
jgi:ubiquinone/menaquinone biosynthesis C-methylase UbiE